MRKKIAVVKFGSELLANNKGVDQEKINTYASLLLQKYKNSDLVIVTSGAVASGRLRVEQAGKKLNDFDNATLAQLGSGSIMVAWENAFERCGVLAGGLLVTHKELEDSTEGPSFTTKLHSARMLHVVSIVNENDALSDLELSALSNGSDNDKLASHIAKNIQAESLDLFTKEGGILSDTGATMGCVNTLNHSEVRSMLVARKQSNKLRGNGRGGILSKFDAAWMAAESGVAVRISSVDDLASGQGRKSTSLIAHE